MKTKTCKQCNSEFTVCNKANNKKFCSSECRDIAYRDERKKQWTKRNRNKYNQKAPGKIQCLECGGWYHKVLTHVIQRHEMSSEEYRERHGLYYSKSIISEQAKEAHREPVMENYDVVVKENLIKKGVKSRFTKGHKKNYERSPQHKKDLKKWLHSK